ncbi:TPA: hypothetical protein ACV5FT_001161, partial [Neisseria meningitidis]
YNRKKVSAAIAVKTTVFHSIMLGMILQVGFSNPTFWALLQWIAMMGMLKVLSDTSIQPTLAVLVGW